MINIHHQIDYINRELEKYRTAYDISLNSLIDGNKGMLPVIVLIQNTIDNLQSIKISLETLKNID